LRRRAGPRPPLPYRVARREATPLARHGGRALAKL